MDWWRDNFWLILAVAIIFVSAGLGIILFCVCRRLLRQGNKWAVAKPLKQQQRDEEKTYENVTDQFSVQLPLCHPGVCFLQKNLPTGNPKSTTSRLLIGK